MDRDDTRLRSVMNRNLVFAVAAIAVIRLVGFAVFHSSNRPSVGAAALGSATASAPEAGAPTPNVPFIEQVEAKQLLDANGATMLDVRDVDAYAAAHIPGALQIPL